jgi:outer membrane protein OmpA-like peptidoglycan-associated protein
MLRRIHLAVAATVILGGASIALQANAQVVDGTTGRVGRCDMFKALGRALPPECGGTGPSTGGATRGRVVIGAPDSGAAKPGTAPAAAPAAAPATAPAGAPATTAAPAAPSAAPAATAAPAPAPRGLGLQVPFALDSDQLTAEAKKIVDQLAEVFKYNPNDRYVIEGHTDAAGGVEYNRSLSERRAQSVIEYLATAHGLPRDRFVARGAGSAQLLLPTDPLNGRNRRVQVLPTGS